MTTLQFNAYGLVVNVHVNGEGLFAHGTKMPHLLLPVEFQAIALDGEPSVAYELLTLHCDFSCKVGPRDEPLGASVPCVLGGFARELTHQQLSIPFDHARLTLLESLRNGEDSFNIFLSFRLVFRKLRKVGDDYAHVTQRFALAQGWLTVPKAAWCERVLPATGFGSILTVEFPTTALDECAGLRNANAALRKAHRLHRDGYYDKAVGECRVALDKFWDDRPKRLRDSWEVKLGAVNHKWLEAALTELRREGNDPHHNAIGRHFDQLESQLFIATTTALVALAARSGVDEKSD